MVIIMSINVALIESFELDSEFVDRLFVNSRLNETTKLYVCL